jgi:hypothetical protein
MFNRYCILYNTEGKFVSLPSKVLQYGKLQPYILQAEKACQGQTLQLFLSRNVT